MTHHNKADSGKASAGAARCIVARIRTARTTAPISRKPAIARRHAMEGAFGTGRLGGGSLSDFGIGTLGESEPNGFRAALNSATVGKRSWGFNAIARSINSASAGGTLGFNS